MFIYSYVVHKYVLHPLCVCNNIFYAQTCGSVRDDLYS